MSDINQEKWDEIKAKLNAAREKLKSARAAAAEIEVQDAIDEASGIIKDVVDIPPGTFPVINE